MLNELDELVEKLSNLNILDSIALVRKLEERWGVSAMQRIGNFVYTIMQEDNIEPQTEFDVILIDCGPKKIEVIKVIRQIIPDCGLKEAKELSEGFNGGVLFRGTDKDTAMRAKDLLEKAGAIVKVV